MCVCVYMWCVSVGFQGAHIWFTIVYQTHVLSRPHTSRDHTAYPLLPTVGLSSSPNTTQAPPTLPVEWTQVRVFQGHRDGVMQVAHSNYGTPEIGSTSVGMTSSLLHASLTSSLLSPFTLSFSSPSPFAILPPIFLNSFLSSFPPLLPPFTHTVPLTSALSVSSASFYKVGVVLVASLVTIPLPSPPAVMIWGSSPFLKYTGHSGAVNSISFYQKECWHVLYCFDRMWRYLPPVSRLPWQPSLAEKQMG